MSVHYRTQGFILKKIDLREADQLLTFYTKDFGRLEILGKAIRKIKSKLRAGAELFYLSDIEFIQGKTHKTLTDAITIEKFKNIRTCSPRSQNLDSLRSSSYSLELRNDLERLKIAYQIAEVADILIKGQEKDEKIWDLINEVFNRLDNWKLEIENCKLKIIYYYFLWNLSSILGYQIDLYNCSFCQKKLFPEKLYFNPKEGGIICLDCFKKEKNRDRSIFLISPEVIKIFRLFLDKNWMILSKLKIGQKQRKELEEVSRSYIDGIINK